MAPTLSPSIKVPEESEVQAARQAPGSALLPCDAWLHLRDSLWLSEREVRVVQGIFNDEENLSMASALAISADLVYRTIQRIYIKLHIGGRAELIVRVMSEYLAFVGDQTQPEMPGLFCWPIKSASGSGK